jgi:radical SAM-linked protein
MRVITRAIIRSSIALIYSAGFNPHPKFSLPLPRNVGLASDDELFCAKILASLRGRSGEASEDPAFADLISRQLPDGFELISAEVTEKPVTYRPVEVEYLVKAAGKIASLQKISEQIHAGSEILVERTINQQGDVKIVDVGKFLKSLEAVQDEVRVFCKVLPGGTIRPDEILKLLGIEPNEISSAIIRKHVTWQIDE